MPNVCFYGKVLPVAVPISCILPTITSIWSEKSITMNFDIKIEQNLIVADCSLSAYEQADLVFVYIRAIDLVRAAVNILAYAHGVGFTVVLDEVLEDNGVRKPYVSIDTSLPQLFTAFDTHSPNWYGEIVNIVCTEPAVFMALDDLIVSIALPHHSTVNCARAVEGLRKLLAPNLSEKQQWDNMHSVLNTSKAYVFMITDNSKSGRHGDRVRIEGEITTEVTRRAWVIMNRFFAFRKGGNLPLSQIDYPILTD
ncbi:hypothetical protein CJD36_009200 [Flavipsychrobacter stenotrophus]|uniref:Uncharacterized protein n=1 Tax=Flavipsychrobacter stenotrophus TaxID=2077091 RepID=A0A2S7SZ34_9BACT|nr:hypothetical protein [Flavipsychrobacter stenotrophus]PQJ11958.1 hypothetical protein CJD36_009200 [Flavipsychrobacter stenotrophus]